MDSVTVVYVAFGVTTLDLRWIPEHTPIIVVHNDDRLGPLWRDEVMNLRPGRNVGFGSGVNLALAEVSTPRVLLCNPDTRLERHHFTALASAPADDLATIPLIERDGRPTSVVNPYLTPLAFLATAWRLGRVAPRGSRRRALLTSGLGHWGRRHQTSMATSGCWPLSQWWASGAVLAGPTAALRAVGGFDESFFLYYEDADLQQRLGRRFHSMRIVVPDVEPGVHDVGGCAHIQQGPGDSQSHRIVAAHRQNSAVAYARRQPGRAWSFVANLVERTPAALLS